MKTWWQKTNAHQEVMQTHDRIRSADKARLDRDLRHVRLYGGRAFAGLLPGDYFKGFDSTVSNNDRLTWNVIQSICDSVQAKLGKQKPRPLFLTDNADWSKQQKAKKLTQFVEALFYKENVYDKAQRVLMDAEITGTGAMKVSSHNGRVIFDRVFPWELTVDPVEAMYGEPRNMYQCRYIDRGVLSAVYPKAADAIKKASRGTPVLGVQEQESDLIKVVEAWHLASGVKGDKGKHCIAIEGATLFEEDYEAETFPFALLRWSELPVGFWGQGIAERITGIQIEINVLLQDIQERFNLASKAMMLVPRGAKITKQHVINENGVMLEYSGDIPPQIVSFQTTQPEIYQHLERLYLRAFDQIGASQLSATSRKPAGLNSGAALREYNDIETERFIIDGQNYEHFFMVLAKLAVNELKKQEELGNDVTLNVITKSRKRSQLQKMDWNSIVLEQDAYEMKVFPASALPSTPAGRIATVEQWLGAGFISKEQAMSLLDFPDLDSAMSLDTAAYEIVLDAIEKMLEDGVYISPEPYQNLQLTLQLTQAAYLRAKLDGVPEENLQLLRDYMAMTTDLMAPLEPQAPPALPATM